jgi:hypothetical protein
MRALLPLAVLCLALAACASAPQSSVSRNGRADKVINSGSETGFDPNQLIKTDIDRVADANRQEIFASLKMLAEKLYKRNPREWKKSGAADIDAALARLVDPAAAWRFAEFEGRYGTDAMQLAFRDEYRGDRVLALVGGLGGMLQSAFNEKSEFYMTDDLDPQKLYNSARNIEIAIWRLSQAHDAEGRLFLLSNDAGKAEQQQNLSFEREFGKIIGHLDLLSKIVADKSNRTIVKMVQSLATAVFLPVVLLR